MKIKLQRPIRVMKLTLEDWCGSYTLQGWHKGVQSPKFLEVSFYGQLTDGKFRTSVWGNDDFGMDYDANTYRTAWKKFQEVIAMEYVSRITLKKMGFVNA